MIQAIIEAMKQEIAKYKLEVLQHYPKDLEIDMATLERFAHPGMKIAWMVGDSHTHIAPLGVTTCNRNGPDQQSSRFSARNNCE